MGTTLSTPNESLSQSCTPRSVFSGSAVDESNTVAFVFEILGFALGGALIESASILSVFAAKSPPVEAPITAPNTYLFDTSLFQVDAIFEIFASLVRVYFIVIGIRYYSLRVNTYPACDSTDPLLLFDWIWIFIYAAGIPIYSYRLLWGVMNADIYSGTDLQVMEAYNLYTFFRDVPDTESGYAPHMVSFLFQTVTSPKRLSLMLDLLFMFGFMSSQQWGAIAYLAPVWIPIFVAEFMVFPFYPFLDTPPIPFWRWLDPNNLDNRRDKNQLQTDYIKQILAYENADKAQQAKKTTSNTESGGNVDLIKNDKSIEK